MGPGAYDNSESERDLWKDSMISTVEAIWIDETDRKNKNERAERRQTGSQWKDSWEIWTSDPLPKGTQRRQEQKNR